MDWKKEVEFQKGQFLGMFAGLGEDLKTTGALMAVIVPFLAVYLLLMEFVLNLFV